MVLYSVKGGEAVKSEVGRARNGWNQPKMRLCNFLLVCGVFGMQIPSCGWTTNNCMMSVTESRREAGG
jgi:hypothetical protein